MNKDFRLTSLSKSGGWAGKASLEELDRVLDQLNINMISENLLVDHTTKDDAAIYKVSETNAIVFTTDFFSPVVDDPYVFGQIAAANAISDVYAMGGNPFLALNISCFRDNLPNKYIERSIPSDRFSSQFKSFLIHFNFCFLPTTFLKKIKILDIILAKKIFVLVFIKHLNPKKQE